METVFLPHRTNRARRFDTGRPNINLQPPRRTPRLLVPAGFTLVELLVVIAIIAVLAALLVPAANSMMGKGDQTKCMNQLKTFGNIFSQYAADNNMNIAWQKWDSATFSGSTPNPYAAYWGPKGQSQVIKARACPANKFPVSGWSDYRFPQLGTNNKTMSTNDTTFKLTAATRPSQLLLLIEVVPKTQVRYNLRESCWDTAVKPLCENETTSMVRHSGGVNALFGDFHVEHVKWSRLDPSTDEGRSNRSQWLTLY